MVPSSLSTEGPRVKYTEEEVFGKSVLLGLGYYSRSEHITICNAPPYSPCPVLVSLYAAMGLHGYNLLQGKKLKFSRVLEYSKTRGPPAASTYRMALDAIDPCLNLVRIFETCVSELTYGQFSLRCNFVIPHGETRKIYNIGDEVTSSREAAREYNLSGCMPVMPPLDPFQDTNRFYLLNKSEVEENEWVRMYLDLAFAATHRATSKSPDLSKLKIVQVAVSIDTSDEEGPGPGLCRPTNAVFYIRHMDRSKARVKKKDVDRIAIVRRIYNHRTGCFSLVGQILSSQTIPKPITDEIPSLQSSQTIPKPKDD
ncbi:unnamed protein product [Microthlaspi erraticum]|uniref:Uncharacterized protein n=1 Tax=Microthlaspi erraticum TaxID=1685480 RepID=A0A6D2ITA8_9BRAS|nr:unnamed protein product [Microthlaspi erraticum]